MKIPQGFPSFVTALWHFALKKIILSCRYSTLFLYSKTYWLAEKTKKFEVFPLWWKIIFFLTSISCLYLSASILEYILFWRLVLKIPDQVLKTYTYIHFKWTRLFIIPKIKILFKDQCSSPIWVSTSDILICLF